MGNPAPWENAESLDSVRYPPATDGCAALRIRGPRDGVESVEDHASDRFARVHEIKGFIDFLKRHRVGDEIVDVDFLFHVPINDLRNIGAAPRASEGRTFPHSPGDKLERTRFDLLASAG